MFINLSLQGWGKGSHSNQVRSDYSPRIINFINFPTTNCLVAALGCLIDLIQEQFIM